MTFLFANTTTHRRIVMFITSGAIGILFEFMYRGPYIKSIWYGIQTAVIGLLAFEIMYRTKRWLNLKTLAIYAIIIIAASRWLHVILYSIERGDISLNILVWNPFAHILSRRHLVPSLLVTGLAYFLILSERIEYKNIYHRVFYMLLITVAWTIGAPIAILVAGSLPDVFCPDFVSCLFPFVPLLIRLFLGWSLSALFMALILRSIYYPTMANNHVFAIAIHCGASMLIGVIFAPIVSLLSGFVLGGEGAIGCGIPLAFLANSFAWYKSGQMAGNKTMKIIKQYNPLIMGEDIKKISKQWGVGFGLGGFVGMVAFFFLWLQWFNLSLKIDNPFSLLWVPTGFLGLIGGAVGSYFMLRNISDTKQTS